MGKDGKDRDQVGKGVDGKGKDDKDNDKKDNTNNLGYYCRGIDNKDSLRNDRVVITSCHPNPTRTTLRGIKSKRIESRPPWNTGSPSPTNIKATSAPAKRSIRALPSKFQNRPKTYSLGDTLSSPNQKDSHQIAASKAKPPPGASSPEPTNLIISPKGSKTGIECGYKRLEEFLQNATESVLLPRAKHSTRATPTNQSPSPNKDESVDQVFTEVESQDQWEIEAAAIVTAPTEVLKNSIQLAPVFGEQTQAESFFESELMSSPKLKVPLSSPALTAKQINNQRTTQTSAASNSKTSEQICLEEKLAGERRRTYILAVLANVGNQNGYLALAREQPNPTFQPDREVADEQAASQCTTQRSSTVPKPQNHTSRKWPASGSQPNPETSEEEQAAPQPAVQLVPNKLEVPSPSPSLWPAAQLQLDSETSDEEYTCPQPENSLPSKIKVQCLSSSELPVPQLRGDLESTDEERATCRQPQTELGQPSLVDEQPAPQQSVESTQPLTAAQCHNPSASKSTSSRIVRGDSPFHADGELSGEDCTFKWRSVMNRGRRLRQSRSQCSINPVKWDPAILACGPVAATLGPSLPKANALPKASKSEPEKCKLTDDIEVFRKTISEWKKIDRKAIRKLLESLKNLDSDEDSITKPRQDSKKQTNQPKSLSKTAPRKGLNPLAPIFREPSQQASDKKQQENSLLSVGQRLPYSLGDNEYELHSSKETIQICKHTPPANRSCSGPLVPNVRKQEPIWIKKFQPSLPRSPITLDQEDKDFQEFCRANNFTPVTPVNANPMIPIPQGDQLVPFLAPYPDLILDPVFLTNMLPLDDKQPNLSTVRTPLSQLAGQFAPYYQPTANQGISFTLEETSEPMEDEGWREALALDPVWGIQILEHFVKKYPMTGQCKPTVPVSEQNENRKHAEKGQQNQRQQIEVKASGVKAHVKRAAEIQQKLEMILLQQRERKALLAPAHKVHATEIQQRLEIMLYKLKEQKALGGGSMKVPNKVPKRAETEKSSEKNFGKDSDKDMYSSQSTSKSSKGTVKHIEKLR